MVKELAGEEAAENLGVVLLGKLGVGAGAGSRSL